MKLNLSGRYIGLLSLLVLSMLTGCSKHGGKVTDAETKQPIANAIVMHNGVTTRSDANGRFSLSKFDAKAPVVVKMPGFRRAQAKAERFSDCNIRLEPFQVRALYLSFGALKTEVRDLVISMLNKTNLNTLVVDIKNERGYVSIDTDAGTEMKIKRASPPSIEDARAFIKELHEKDIYVIGRVITFRDDALCQSRPEWGIVDTKTDQPWHDGTKMKWSDPTRKEVRAYNIAVAKTAAEAGFDEILFATADFPTGDSKRLKFSEENSAAHRAEVRKEFWTAATQELAPYNVFVSVEFWGPNLFFKNETENAKQMLKTIHEYVDYICPTAYPADLTGVLPHRGKYMADFTYRAVTEMIKRGESTVGSAKKFRPWLQNYKSSLMATMPWSEREIALQMQATIDAGTSGFMLWHGASRYTNTVEALQLLAAGPVTPVETPVLKDKELVTEVATTNEVSNPTP